MVFLNAFSQNRVDDALGMGVADLVVTLEDVVRDIDFILADKTLMRLVAQFLSQEVAIFIQTIC